MAVTGTKTVRDIVTQALVKARITPFGQAAQSEDASVARDELNVMLKSWQNMGYNLWTKTSGSLTLTTAASYALGPARPLSVLSARLNRSGVETPMSEITRDEYDNLPLKTSTGLPTLFYYDRQREDARLYVWPVLASANGETVEYTYERELEDITSLNDTIDVPGEWWDAVIYNLASRMLDTVPKQNPGRVHERASGALQAAAAFDHEGSVFFAGGD